MNIPIKRKIEILGNIYLIFALIGFFCFSLTLWFVLVVVLDFYNNVVTEDILKVGFVIPTMFCILILSFIDKRIGELRRML